MIVATAREYLAAAGAVWCRDILKFRVTFPAQGTVVVSCHFLATRAGWWKEQIQTSCQHFVHFVFQGHHDRSIPFLLILFCMLIIA